MGANMIEKWPASHGPGAGRRPPLGPSSGSIALRRCSGAHERQVIRYPRSRHQSGFSVGSHPH